MPDLRTRESRSDVASSGSTIGIPSPPAILLASGELVTPDIRDAERLQGLPVDWTLPATRLTRSGHRWKLVGNAVTSDVAEWVGRRLRSPLPFVETPRQSLPRGKPWPRAAWNVGDGRHASTMSAFPVRRPCKRLHEFLEHPTARLSARATAGFLGRARISQLRFPPGFLDAVAAHLQRQQLQAVT